MTKRFLIEVHAYVLMPSHYQLRSFRWSSYRAYAGYERPPEWLTRTEILRRVKGGSEGHRRELGTKVGGMDYAAVSEAIRQFDRKKDKNPEVRNALKRSREILNLET